MEKYYVLVAGNGATSRQNIEALMEDHYYAHGENGVVVMPLDKTPTQAQTFVAQFAKDKNKEIVFIAPDNANLNGLPAASLVNDSDPISKAVEIVVGSKSSAFLLWDDGDETSLAALSACKRAQVPCYDLTNGLSVIDTTGDIPEPTKVTFPAAEQVSESEDDDGEEEEESNDEEDEEEYEDDEEEVEDIEDIYAGVEAIARVFARVLIEEWKANLEDKS